MSETVGPEPQLRFRLIGRWHPVMLGDVSSEELISDYVRETVGARDELATARALVRRELRSAVAAADDGTVKALFLMSELRPGVPLPASLTVISPSDLRMSPAVGTRSGTVLDVLEASFRELERRDLDTLTRFEAAGTDVLRLHSVEAVTPDVDDAERAAAPEAILAEVDQLNARALSAEYWYAVPGSKHVVVVKLSTPAADIPHLMLDFFDSIVRASYFETPPIADETDDAEVEETAGAASPA